MFFVCRRVAALHSSVIAFQMPRLRRAAWSSLAAVLLTGCASTGTPRPPSLHLPQTVRDLAAQRTGATVHLQFTVPTLSTDRQPLAGRHGGTPLAAEVCRGTTATSPCARVHTGPVAPGEAVRLQDALPAALQTGPGAALYYRVVVVNAQGRRSAPSSQAIAAAGTAPAPIVSLSASTTRRGIQLTWQRVPRAAGEIAIQAEAGDTVRTLAVPGDPGGAVDRAPRVGQAITYTVARSVGVAGFPRVTLRGEPATVTLTRAADTFAPATPTGLVAVSVQMEGAPPEIDLSWEPAADADVAGYIVERAIDAQPPQPLGKPLATPSARDLAVRVGPVYRYTVRAVDRNGNRSEPSAAATEQLHP